MGKTNTGCRYADFSIITQENFYPDLQNKYFPKIYGSVQNINEMNNTSLGNMNETAYQISILS